PGTADPPGGPAPYPLLPAGLAAGQHPAELAGPGRTGLFSDPGATLRGRVAALLSGAHRLPRGLGPPGPDGARLPVPGRLDRLGATRAVDALHAAPGVAAAFPADLVFAL